MTVLFRGFLPVRHSERSEESALALAMTEKTFYVYILASRSRRLYTGVTSNLERRVYEHRDKLVKGHAERYNIKRLVYFEQTTEAYSAISREKQLKGLLRAKKIALIEAANPMWQDLSESWFTADSSLRSERQACRYSRSLER